MSQQKENVVIQHDLDSPECLGVIAHLSCTVEPAGMSIWTSVTLAGGVFETKQLCLKQTAEPLKVEEMETGTHVAPGRDGLTPPSMTVISLGGNGFTVEVVSSWYQSTPLQPRLCLLQRGAYA